MPRAKPGRRTPAKRVSVANGSAVQHEQLVVQHELDVHREELAAQNEELRRTNAELTTVKERYAQLFDVAPIGYFTLDDAGRVIEVNATGAEMLGTRRSGLFGAKFEEHVLPSKREAFRELRRHVHETRKAACLDTLIVTATRRFHAHLEAAPLGVAGLGAPQCILCVSDETDRRRTEDERRAFEARLADVQRHESLGLLAGGVAHDFNNILAVVLVHADLALSHLGADGPAREDVLAMQSAASRAADLSRQMLAYAGRGKLRTERVDLGTLVRAMDSLLRSSIAKSVVLALDLATDLPRLWGDPVQLQQIVLNLVVNASEAIGDGGGRITIRSHAAGSGRVALEVSDDGPGMGEDTQRRAFDPFFSTKLAGRGLGLAVVQGNVRAHEGTVTLVSAQGRGTTIRIELPAAAGAGGDGDGVALKPRREAPEASPVKGHVLVVDDEPTVRAAVTSVLESAGLSVEAVADGLAATDAVARAPGTYAAVLLDLTMPGMDGRDTLQALKRLRGDLPVVVTSGYVDAAMDGRLAMADGVLPKPFDAATLEDAIRRAMRLARS